jgi:hypothetical protein
MAAIITGNFGRHVSTAEFLANVRDVDDELGLGAVLNLQEVDEDDTPNEHHGFHHEMLELDWAGWETREPIGFGKNWTIEDQQVTKGSPGVRRLSPARTITEAVAKHKSGLLVAFLNTHYPRNSPELLDEWKQLRQVHVQRTEHYFERGITSVSSTDANRVSFMPLHHGDRILAHRGLDWIRCTEHPDGTQLEVIKRFSIDLTIDGHDAQGALVELHNPKEHR